MSPKNAVRRCVIYARISVTKDESVSIERTIEACRQYAAAYGWQVAKVFTDEGVSASDSRPEDRPGWRELLASPESFDTVLIWKVDRLSRRITDFWDTYKVLAGQGKALVSVEERLDMTTAMGRTFAGIIAGFAEQEAETISLRVAAARRHLIRNGRVVGGKVPYGWRSIDNPDGPGKVLAHDPERIDFVRGMVERVQAGHTVYSVMQWLNDVGAPTPTSRAGTWAYSTVERTLRHPLLAGMTPFNPGNTERRRGDDVLRDATGLPVVVDSLAVMTPAEWRAMVAQLDGRGTAQSRPRSGCAATSSLLSGLVWCAEHLEPTRMHRGTTQGRPGYSCPACHQTITGFEDVVVEEFLAAKGAHLRWRRVEEVHEGGAALLPEIEARLDELADLIRQAPDREARRSLQEQQASLLDLRDEKRAQAPVSSYRWEGADRSFAEDWALATSVADRRAILDDGLSRVTVRRGRPGRRTKAQLLARLSFDWKGDSGPLPVPDETWIAAP